MRSSHRLQMSLSFPGKLKLATPFMSKTQLKHRIHIDCTPVFKIGDPKPQGYIARQEWAELHLKAGLKQETCCFCGLWFFPHELSKKRSRSVAFKSNGTKVVRSVATCKECEKRNKSINDILSGDDSLKSQPPSSL